MIKRIFTLSLALFLCLTPALGEARAGDGATDFGLSWLSQECMGSEVNPVISPVSAYFALAMAALGAQGETREEICRAIGEDEETLSQSAGALMAALSGERECAKITIANSAWVDQRYSLSDQYARALSSALGAEAYSVDLSGDIAVKRVNQWVSARTNGLIERALDQPLSEDAALALVNTLYFKADWARAFDATSTASGAFTLDTGESASAEYMYRKMYLPYFTRGDGARGACLEYADGQTALLAILPPEGVSALSYAKTLSAWDIFDMRNGAERQSVRLSLPRVKADGDYDMKEALMGMGVSRAFDPIEADFSGMLEGAPERVWISKAIQKVRMTIDESGTEAAAFTMIAIKAAGAMIEPPSVELTFDRSYIYVVLDKATNAALFLGVVNDPSALAQ